MSLKPLMNYLTYSVISFILFELWLIIFVYIKTILNYNKIVFF